MKAEDHKPYREERPWGEFIKFTQNEPSTVKILTVNPHQAFSLQHHKEREEFWHVISGSGKITIGTEEFEIKPGLDFFIERQVNHRIEAMETSVVVLEISYGSFSEDDIVRIEDKYGRI